MIAGTLMLMDSVDRTFENLITEAYEEIDVTITPRVDVTDEFGEAPTRGIDAALLDRVREVEGIGYAEPEVADDSIAVLDADGNRIGPRAAPHIAVSVPQDLSRSSESSLVEFVGGRVPSAADEIAIDARTAEAEGLELGDPVRVTGAAGPREYAVAGIYDFFEGDSFFGASLVLLTLPEAQRLTGKEGRYDEISVGAAPGTTPGELADELAAALPDEVEVRTADEAAAEEIADVESAFGFLRDSLLVFAGIAIFVGAFLIFNTFSVTVAQRVREHAMLRTLGASARQVLGAVLGEAAIVGLLASALGILGGLGFVELVKALLRGVVGLDLPSAGIRIGPGLVAVAAGVGVGATVLSALVPAIRATRVAPLEALRESAGAQASGSRRRRLVRPIAATVVLGVALLSVLGGLFGDGGVDEALFLLALGLILLFVGLAMIGDRAVPPLASVIGWPLELLRGVTGRLARENAQRNPGRTATTAAALMIGVTLVVFVGVLASSLRASIDGFLDQQFAGDIAVRNVDGESPVPGAVAPELAGVEGVAAASAFASARVRVDGIEVEPLIAGVDPTTITAVTRFEWDRGSDGVLRLLDRGGAIVESRWADENGIDVGERLTVTGPGGDRITVTVAGSVDDAGGLFVDGLAISRDALRDELGVVDDDTVYVDFAPGADPAASRARVDEFLASRFPNLEARSQEELRDDWAGEVDALLALIYALLGLSVIVSIFGIVNTLSLTVLERTRELGMLRAIGASRSQVRRMIRYESVITALLGALTGTAIGLGLAIATVDALAEAEGLVLAISTGLLAAVLAAALAIGVLAALGPARSASRLDVVEALTYE